jgi:hypothetical protein
MPVAGMTESHSPGPSASDHVATTPAFVRLGVAENGRPATRTVPGVVATAMEGAGGRTSKVTVVPPRFPSASVAMIVAK